MTSLFAITVCEDSNKTNTCVFNAQDPLNFKTDHRLLLSPTKKLKMHLR